MCEKYILAKIFYYYTSTQFLFVYIQRLSKLNKANQAHLRQAQWQQSRLLNGRKKKWKLICDILSDN